MSQAAFSFQPGETGASVVSSPVIFVTAKCAPPAAHSTVLLSPAQGRDFGYRLTPARCFNMDRFAIITNRKRAIIALVHSVFFLGVAGLQLAISHAEAFSIHREKIAGSIVLLTIYVIVTTVLLVLL